MRAARDRVQPRLDRGAPTTRSTSAATATSSSPSRNGSGAVAHPSRVAYSIASPPVARRSRSAPASPRPSTPGGRLRSAPSRLRHRQLLALGLPGWARPTGRQRALGPPRRCARARPAPATSPSTPTARRRSSTSSSSTRCSSYRGVGVFHVSWDMAVPRRRRPTRGCRWRPPRTGCTRCSTPDGAVAAAAVRRVSTPSCRGPTCSTGRARGRRARSTRSAAASAVTVGVYA